MHIRSLNKDIRIIRDTVRTPIAGDNLLAWMEEETCLLRETAKGLAVFDVQARWPTHGDLCEGNTLPTEDDELHFLDCNDLSLGDRVLHHCSFGTLSAITRTSTGSV